MDNAHREPHVIVELAVYAVDPAGGAHHRRTVEKALAGLFDDPELRWAVVSLVSFAKRLDDAGHTDSAEWLLDVACTAREALMRQGIESRLLAEDLGRMKTQRFRAFRGEDLRKRAPRYGAPAGPGTVLLRELLPNAPKR